MLLVSEICSVGDKTNNKRRYHKNVKIISARCAVRNDEHRPEKHPTFKIL